MNAPTNPVPPPPPKDQQPPPPRKSWVDVTTALVAALGSVLTIGLTYANYVTKKGIDEAEQELKRQAQAIDAGLREREQTIAEDKAKVERLKWVFDSIVPALTGQKTGQMTDEDVRRKAAAATAVLRLALDANQAQTLLVGLEQSAIPEVQKAASKVRADIGKADDTEVKTLIARVTANEAETRRPALNRMRQAYSSSSLAVARVLDRLNRIDSEPLENEGYINLLYFLARTDTTAWAPDLIDAANKLIPKLRSSGRGGTQWKVELEGFATIVKQASSRST
jgi:hypothetical protein